MRAKIKEILFERKKFAAYQQGIMTGEELRNVLLAHMDTLIFRCAGVAETNWQEDKPLSEKIEAALGIPPDMAEKIQKFKK